MTIEEWLFIYFVGLLWILFGGVIGWGLTNRVIFVFVVQLMFAFIAFLLFPGLAGVV